MANLRLRSALGGGSDLLREATPRERLRRPDTRAELRDDRDRPLPLRRERGHCLLAQLRVDAAVGNWYTSTHPDSLFVNHLLAGRPTAERRYALSDNVHTVHHRGGPSEQTRLTTVAEIEAVLERDFLLDLSGIDGLRAALARFV